jgi:tetratricopeptide (TPR) repeat protein
LFVVEATLNALSLADQADLAVRLATEEPDKATALARETLSGAVATGQPAVESSALRALGLAARTSHQIADATSYLGASIRAAERATRPDLADAARISLAGAFAYAGEGQRALETLAAVAASGPLGVVAASDRATILGMLGRYDEALDCYGPVVRAFRRLGDQLREARSLDNRGLLHVYTGRFLLADADQARAERLFVGLGLLTEAAQVCHNRGFAATRRGDLPAALAFFDRAERRYAEAGVPARARALDRAEVLLAAGLTHDARDVATSALISLRSGGNQLALAEGLVLLADVAYLAGDHKASGAAAGEATTLLVSQDRPGWAAIATSASARAAGYAADVLDRAGVSTKAAEAHFVAGRLWLAATGPSRRSEADRELRLAAQHRGRGPAAGRLSGWHAEATRRLAAGDRTGGLTALRAALAVIAGQQAGLGASELRAHVSIHAGDVARSGLRLAIESGRPRQILDWMERYRANSLHVWPVRPPGDEQLAERLAELRGVVGDIAAELSSGGDPRPLVRRQAQLEREVRERHWLTSGLSPASKPDSGRRAPADTGVPSRPASPGARSSARRAHLALDATLGDRALVELAVSDGVLHAVVVAGGRCWYRRLAPAATVIAELDHLRFALRRAAYGGALGPRPTGGQGQVATAAGRLDELLFGPLRTLIAGRSLVVVPTGALHAAPWGALATTAERAVTVAPSARLWQRRSSASTPAAWEGSADSVWAGRRSVVIVAGPGLPGASAEVRSLRQIYPEATALGGRRARASAVTAALGRATVAHIAAHASFRADNGLWSAIQLADGPLTVYELDAIRRPPELVVLSACQSGLSAVRPGDEMLGFVAALLGLGTRAVIASVVPVGDDATAPLMVALHERLRAGDPPAEALAAARRGRPSALAASFVCFGAG